MFRIGGFLPLSLCDYPGRVAAVVFTRGCNFRCPFCHNFELVDGSAPAVMDDAELFAFLEKRRGRVVIQIGCRSAHLSLASGTSFRPEIPRLHAWREHEADSS